MGRVPDPSDGFSEAFSPCPPMPVAATLTTEHFLGFFFPSFFLDQVRYFPPQSMDNLTLPIGTMRADSGQSLSFVDIALAFAASQGLLCFFHTLDLATRTMMAALALPYARSVEEVEKRTSRMIMAEVRQHAD